MYGNVQVALESSGAVGLIMCDTVKCINTAQYWCRGICVTDCHRDIQCATQTEGSLFKHCVSPHKTATSTSAFSPLSKAGKHFQFHMCVRYTIVWLHVWTFPPHLRTISCACLFAYVNTVTHLHLSGTVSQSVENRAKAVRVCIRKSFGPVMPRFCHLSSQCYVAPQTEIASVTCVLVPEILACCL